ncbi:unnamed protein product [Miscanthus lutarioriparius]|uniref:Uncharacterized protein n=1 Tax=Miscanthus lutarioriparius TaxID=422564 RepID=A0A811MFK9_9POAL|nr:unnamed protein product [Miscanthus lutarioriparius]
MTVIGDMDTAVAIAKKLKKLSKVDIVSVGPPRRRRSPRRNPRRGNRRRRRVRRTTRTPCPLFNSHVQVSVVFRSGKGSHRDLFVRRTARSRHRRDARLSSCSSTAAEHTPEPWTSVRKRRHRAARPLGTAFSLRSGHRRARTRAGRASGGSEMGGEEAAADKTGTGTGCVATDEEGRAHPQPEPCSHALLRLERRREGAAGQGAPATARKGGGEPRVPPVPAVEAFPAIGTAFLGAAPYNPSRRLGTQPDARQGKVGVGGALVAEDRQTGPGVRGAVGNCPGNRGSGGREGGKSGSRCELGTVGRRASVFLSFVDGDRMDEPVFPNFTASKAAFSQSCWAVVGPLVGI